MNDLVVDVYQPLLVAFADDPNLSGGQVYLIQFEISALTSPDARVGKQGHDGVVPLAAALQQALAKCFHIFLGNRAGACVLQLDFHKVVLQYDSICLLAGFYKPIVVDAQRGQVVVDGLGTVTPDVTHIGNVFQHVGPVELTWALAKCLLAPPKILRDVLAVN